MKSLASADLDFFLTTGRQLLNIGKPFSLEGIGTLQKNKEGRLDFAPGDYVVARLDEPYSAASERKSPSSEKRASRFEEAPRQQDSGNTNIRQTLLLVGLVGGLIIIGWGGYYLYKRNNFVEPGTENRATVLPDTTASRTDSTGGAGTSGASGSVSQKADTSTQTAGVTAPATNPGTAAATPAATTPSAPAAAGTIPIPGVGQSLYRFVILQTANKDRALRRYNQLLGYQLNIKMDQKDSAFFKLYFPIAATIRDTTHIKDSLADVYASHVVIEQ